MQTDLALGACMLCGQSITRQFYVCAKCELRFGLDMPKRLWPSWAKQRYVDHEAQRRSELARLKNEGDTQSIAAFVDARLYGEGNTDYLDNAESPLDESTKAGALRCVRCGTGFADIWATWPAPPSQWQDPTCPSCGVSHYENV